MRSYIARLLLIHTVCHETICALPVLVLLHLNPHNLLLSHHCCSDSLLLLESDFLEHFLLRIVRIWLETTWCFLCLIMLNIFGLNDL